MTPNQLLQLQSLPFTDKLEYSKQLVKEWYEYWNGEVAILFSGGKDSTVHEYCSGFISGSTGAFC